MVEVEFDDLRVPFWNYEDWKLEEVTLIVSGSSVAFFFATPFVSTIESRLLSQDLSASGNPLTRANTLSLIDY